MRSLFAVQNYEEGSDSGAFENVKGPLLKHFQDAVQELEYKVVSWYKGRTTLCSDLPWHRERLLVKLPCIV